MESLTKHKCVPCEKGGPVATTEEIDSYKLQVPEWNMVVVRMGNDGNTKSEDRYVYNKFFKAISKAIQ